MKFKFFIFLNILFFIVACSAPQDVKLTLTSVGDTMKYNQEILQVKAGSNVTLTFINKAKMAGMNHNVIILKPKTNLKKFASEALAHGPNYVPPSDRIIAQTKMTNPGETVSITFVMPKEKGYYPYVCTFPGHASSMQGVIRVN